MKQSKQQAAAKNASRSTLSDVMRGRSGGRGAHQPRSEKRQPCKARRWEREA